VQLQTRPAQTPRTDDLRRDVTWGKWAPFAGLEEIRHVPPFVYLCNLYLGYIFCASTTYFDERRRFSSLYLICIGLALKREGCDLDEPA